MPRHFHAAGRQTDATQEIGPLFEREVRHLGTWAAPPVPRDERAVCAALRTHTPLGSIGCPPGLADTAITTLLLSQQRPTYTKGAQ